MTLIVVFLFSSQSKSQWEASSKNVAQRLVSMKSNKSLGTSMAALFGDLMTMSDNHDLGLEDDEHIKMIPVKSHPEYKKFFRMLEVGGDASEIMIEMKSNRLDGGLLFTPEKLIPFDDKSDERDRQNETNFTSMFSKKQKQNSSVPDVYDIQDSGLDGEDSRYTSGGQGGNSAQKYDPANYIYVSLSKPLGIGLQEISPNEAKGVYVESCAPGGKAEASGLIYPGLVLISACGTDVQEFDFDSVMNILREAPSDEPIDLILVDPTTQAPPTAYGYDSYSAEYEVQHQEPFSNAYEIENVAGRVDLPSRSEHHISDSTTRDSEKITNPAAESASPPPYSSQIHESSPKSNGKSTSKKAALAVLAATKRRKAEKPNLHSSNSEFSDFNAFEEKSNSTYSVFGFEETEASDSFGASNIFGISSVDSISNNANGGVFGVSNIDNLSDNQSRNDTLKTPSRRPVSARMERGFAGLAQSIQDNNKESISAIHVSPVTPTQLAVSDGGRSSTLDSGHYQMNRPVLPPRRKPGDVTEDATARSTPEPSQVKQIIKTESPSISRAPVDTSVKSSPAVIKPSPLTKSSSKITLDNSPVVSQSAHVLVTESGDFNQITQKPISVFDSPMDQHRQWSVIDSDEKAAYGLLSVNNDFHYDVTTIEGSAENTLSRGTQTDYSAFIDADNQTAYQMMLGEKAEIQAILEKVRAEERAATIRIQQAEDESFRRCQEREIYLIEMLRIEEEKARARIQTEELRLESKVSEIEAAWTELKTAEETARQFHHLKLNDLTQIANILTQHHKKLLDDKRKVGRQRMALDLALKNINNFTQFNPSGAPSPSPMVPQFQNSQLRSQSPIYSQQYSGPPINISQQQQSYYGTGLSSSPYDSTRRFSQENGSANRGQQQSYSQSKRGSASPSIQQINYRNL